MKKDLPKSTEQSVKFFEEFIRKNEVQDFILRLRKEVGIPPKGITFKKIDDELLSREVDYFLGYIPFRIYKMLGKDYEEQRKNSIKITSDCYSFVAKQGINSSFISSMFSLYLIFNKTLPYFPDNFKSDDLIAIHHLPSKLSFFKKAKILGILVSNSYKKEEKVKLTVLESVYNYINNISKKYSIALYINPNISKRQLLDFISKNWDEIKKHRNNKRFNFNKIRKKKNQKINDFIYEKRDLPRNEIMSLANKKFKYITDPGNIRKIIALEKKKRH